MAVAVITIALVTTANPASAQPLDCPAGMSHYWTLDETSSGSYSDSYGSLNLTCTLCPTPVSGLIGGAQDFGDSSRVSATADGSFDWPATSSFTIEFWMKSGPCTCTSTSFDCNQVIVGRFGAASPWWIGVNCQEPEEQLLRCYFTNADIYSSMPVTDSEWRHVAFVFDEPAGEYRLYIDGALDVTQAEAGANRGGSSPLQIGYVTSSPYYFYHGLLDELALYDEALSDAEIEQHYNAGLAGNGYCTPSNAPFITTSPVTTATVGQSYTYDVDATGTPAPAYSLSTFPSGMNINTVTGVITWTPAAAGNYDVEVLATNTEGSDSQPFTIEVSSATGCATGLVHYWDFNETSSGTYADIIGGADATCVDCPTPAVGKVGGAQEFDGVNPIVTVASDGSFDWGASDSYSIEFWINQSAGCAGDTQPDNEVVIGRSTGGWWTGLMCEAGDNVSKLRWYVGGNDMFSTSSITDGQWHHVVLVRDNAAGEYIIYVDGIPETTTASAGANLSGAGQITIGHFGPNGANYYRWTGLIDEMAVYNIAMTPAMVSAHNHGGLGSPYCFQCGDADGSGGVTIGDAVFVVNYIFGGGPPPVSEFAADADCTGAVSISDAVYLVSFIFGGGPAPCAGCP